MKFNTLRPALLLNLALIGLFWLLLFNRIHTEWIVNDLYSYGWAVPFLSLYLFAERWRDRPAPAQDRPHPLWLILPALPLLAYIPFRLVNEANPDWVKINVYLTTSVAAFSFAALFAIGRLRYLWHFGFCIIFIYTALPWPVQVEENIVQTLTRWNTMISAETLTLCGQPANYTGNIIQIGDAWVNVADACSGIRSLQTSFMMSLFLGEFYRLGIISRALLMGSSFAVAFALNIGRTITLTSITGSHGAEEMEKWHDHVGNAVMILCLVGLWLLALLFERIKTWIHAHHPAAPAPTHTALIPVPFPTAFVVFGFATLVTAEVTTEAWFRYHESKLPPPIEWSMQWPEKAEKFKYNEFPDRTRAILKYNEAQSASWTTPEGYHLDIYYIRWYPGRVSKFLSGAHYPTVCLPATGLKFISQDGLLPCTTAAREIVLTKFLFQSQSDSSVYVYHSINEDVIIPDAEHIDYRQVRHDERIDSLMRGHRNLGQRVIGVSLTGPKTPAEADAFIRRTLGQLVTPAHSTPAALTR